MFLWQLHYVKCFILSKQCIIDFISCQQQQYDEIPNKPYRDTAPSLSRLTKQTNQSRRGPAIKGKIWLSGVWFVCTVQQCLWSMTAQQSGRVRLYEEITSSISSQWHREPLYQSNINSAFSSIQYRFKSIYMMIFIHFI